MGQVAAADEDMLYDMFGIDAELLIDHSKGIEPVTMADIKSYVPKTSCISSGQVLMRDYEFYEGKLIVREMADLMCLDMVEKGVVTGSVSMTVGYSNALRLPPSRGTEKIDPAASSDSVIIPAVARLYERIVSKDVPIRRVTITCNNLYANDGFYQTDLFSDRTDSLLRDNKRQKAIVEIRKKFGKNALLKAMNFEKGATTIERNAQIGGHKSGE